MLGMGTHTEFTLTKQHLLLLLLLWNWNCLTAEEALTVWQVHDRLGATHSRSHLEKVGLENNANDWPIDLHKRSGQVATGC